MSRANLMSPRKQYLLLGCLAIAHSAALLTLMVVRPWPVPPRYFDLIWIGLATLWFFWPIVLFLHSGRSVIRIVLPLVASAIIAVPWYPVYAFTAAPAFGLPMGCQLSPVSMARYFPAYFRGRADARHDIREGHLAVEVAGGPGDIVTPLRYLEDQYGVEVRAVAGCVVGERTLGHARGYNQVASAEVARRFGAQILDPQTGEPKMKLSN